MESILQSIKKLLGIQSDYTVFDEDLMIHINTVFAILNQLNVGPKDGFMISDDTSTWDDYITDINVVMVKTFIYLKVKLLFDPPASSAVMDSINKTINELEWRLNVECDKDSIIKPSIESIY